MRADRRRARPRAGEGRAPAPKAAYHHGNLRAALIEHGIGLIEAGGPDALTLRAVADATGVSRQAPYHHFGDKAGLLAAIAAEGFARLAGAMATEAAKPASALDRLVALGVVYVRSARARPRQFALCSGTFTRDVSAHPDLVRARDDARAVLYQAVSAHLGPRATERARARATGAAWAMAHGLAHLSLERALFAGSERDEERACVRTALEMVARGMAAPSPGGRGVRAS